ncbi:MAG: hypothetical protein Q4F65_11565 [Propionibacteriaceae bacterium]|nr:hypothetical protein [Propionibacteriaceae bacterium]
MTAIEVRDNRVVAAGAEIVISTDAGEYSAVAEHGGLRMQVADIVSPPDQDNVIFVATVQSRENGVVKGGRRVLMSQNGGRTWRNISGALQNTSVESLALSPDRRWPFAGTLLGGVHRLDTPALAGAGADAP